MTNEAKLREYLKRAIADARDAHRRVRELDDELHEPVAVVGIGCRYPGGVTDPEQFWRLLDDGGDGLTVAPADRGWDTLARLLGMPPVGLDGTLQGGFLDGAAGFDAGFFGISPREALAMSPQQRQLLEVSWEALEYAGIDPTSLRDTDTGVFAGINNDDYGMLVMLSGFDAGGHFSTGASASVTSGRVAYVLGLQGPVATVDTACSSSLVTLHLAVQALRRAECGLALAGGVTVMATPNTFAEFARNSGLATDGRCKSFAAAADGVGWSEGVGVLVLERLSDALRNDRDILAVLRGSAVNSDGASNGLTAPNGPSQRRVIRRALADARLSTQDVDAVEGHGTGTTLGDPIEAQALLATYGRDRPADRPLWLGSVKSNLGHTQGAAGAAGVIKMVLALRHGKLPRTIHVDAPTSEVDWSSGGVTLLTTPVDWQSNDRPRRAGVSSFGLSGTNVHVVLEEPPEREPHAAPAAMGAVPWVVSSRSEAGLRAQLVRLRDFVSARPDLDPADIGHSLIASRALFEHRAVVVGSDRDELLRGLDVAADGRPAANVVCGVAGTARPVFVFPGYDAPSGPDAPWQDVVVDLLDSAPVFAARMRECADALSEFVDWSLWDVLRGAAGKSTLDQVDVAQPAMFAVMVSLAGLWRSFGVQPAAVLGHGPGEIAAACVAGALSLREAAKIAAWRTAQATAARDEMLTVLSGLEPRSADVPFYSSVTGAALDTASLDADYWYRNLRHSVRLDAAIRALAADGHRAYAEVSAHPVLAAAVTETLDAADAVVVGSLRCGESGAARFLTSVAELFVRGVAADLRPAVAGGRRVRLPTYAFQHQRYWLQPAQREPTVAADPADETFWRLVYDEDVAALAARLRVETGPLKEIMPALAAWRRRTTDHAVIDTWRYQVVWTELAERGPATLSGDWLIAVPAGGACREPVTVIIDGLTAHGAAVVPVEVASGDRAALADRLGRECASRSVTGVLSMLALDERVHDEHPTLSAGTAATIALVQALGDARVVAPLWCATRAAVATGPADDSVSLSQSVVWGIGGVLGLDHPDTWGGLVDLPSTVDDRAVRGLCHALSGVDDEDQLAVRHDRLLVRRIVRTPLADRAAEPAAGAPWRPRGTVLITGGTGGVGAHLARWLAGNGAEHLVLTSRRGRDAPGAADLEAELVALGPRVTVAACDIADREAVRRLLDLLPAQYPLTAVLHAAGAEPAPAPLGDLTLADFAAVGKAKVAGAVHLDELLVDRELDAFVLFSSGAAVWGGGGMSAYAAANAFVDALAWQRRAAGRTATSVAWGSWGGGMAAGAVSAYLQRLGVSPMEPRLAVTALGQAIQRDESHLVVADIDWSRFAPSYVLARPRPLLRGLPEIDAILAGEQTAETTRDAELLTRLAALSQPDQERELLGLVREQAAAVLGHPSSEDIDPQAPFKDLGFDSIAAVELRNRLGAATGLTLPATLVFDQPNAGDLTAYLLAQRAPETLAAEPMLAVLDRLEAAARSLAPHEVERTRITGRLQALIAYLNKDGSDSDDLAQRLETASADDLFDFIDNDLGLD